jgi:catechol 2,3-dioxygenase-like lactoylglutathione lyase family enzyme
MSHVRRFDHVGLTVADLDVVAAFFVALGLEVEGRTFVEGEFLDTVCGIPDSRTEIVMLKPPDDGTRLELSSFVRPDSVPGSPAAMANELGLRNVAFEVNDLQAAVDWAATRLRARPFGRQEVEQCHELGEGFLGDVVAGRNGCPAHLAGQRRQIATGSP